MAFNYCSPNEVTPQVKQLLKKFDGAKYELVYVEIKTESTAVKSECYNNVAEKIELEGGKIRYGWAVYDNSYYVKAEKHAIWENPNGELIDVSVANSENIRKIMFIIDDVNEGINVPDIRNNYTGLKAIDDYFMFIDILDVLTLNYANECTNNKGLYIFPPVLSKSIQTLSDLILDYIDYITSNVSGCICGSVKLYKDCHNNKLVQNLINKIDTIILDNKLQRKL